MHIDIVSDTVCPWCFIGKRRLEKALLVFPDLDVLITWRPYQLNPDMPLEGRDRQEYFKEKFGDGDAFRKMSEAVQAAGEADNIGFDFDAIERAPNTLDSHRLIRWAEGAGVQDAVVEALFHAYFENGEDLGDRTVLARIAGETGMDAELVSELLDGDRDSEIVAQEVMSARGMGITGVPTFIFDNKYAVPGAQDPDALIAVISRLLSGDAD